MRAKAAAESLITAEISQVGSHIDQTFELTVKKKIRSPIKAASFEFAFLPCTSLVVTDQFDTGKVSQKGRF